jgi:hypothetical protein
MPDTVVLKYILYPSWILSFLLEHTALRRAGANLSDEAVSEENEMTTKRTALAAYTS